MRLYNTEIQYYFHKLYCDALRVCVSSSSSTRGGGRHGAGRRRGGGVAADIVMV